MNTRQRPVGTKSGRGWAGFGAGTILRGWVGLVLVAGTFAVPICSGQQPNATTRQPRRGSDQSNAAVAASRLAAGDLALEHSRVFIKVGKVGLGHEHAVVGKLQRGVIHLGATEKAGSLVFDMASFDADSPAARQYIGLEGETPASTRDQVNANMLGESILDVGRHPTATFEIDSAVENPHKNSAGLKQFDVSGQFTLHGQARPLKMTLILQEVKNGYAHVRCGFTIKQTDFGIKPFTKALGSIGVADRLEVYGDAWLVAESQVAQQPEAAAPVR